MQWIRYNKGNRLLGNPDLTPNATNPFWFTLTQPLKPVLPDNTETQQLADENSPVFNQIRKIATNINGQMEAMRGQLQIVGKEARLINGLDKTVSVVRLTMDTRSDNSIGGTLFKIMDTLNKNLQSLTDRAKAAREEIDAITSTLLDQLPGEKTLEDLWSLLSKKQVEEDALNATFGSFWKKVNSTFTSQINTLKSCLTQVEKGSPYFPFLFSTPQSHYIMWSSDNKNWRNGRKL